MTTKDEIKKLIFEKIGNPYDLGISKNCKDFFTRHKVMQNDFTVKDLRIKTQIPKIINDKDSPKGFKHFLKKNTKKTPLDYSKKEQMLKNKNKLKQNYNKKIEIEKSSKNNENELNNNESYNISINTEKTEEIQNNKKIYNKIKNKISNDLNNIESRDSSSNRRNYKKINCNKIKYNTDYKKPKKMELDFSDEDILDENDNIKPKIFNTYIKNKSNLNYNCIKKNNKKEKKKIQNDNQNILSKKDKGYQIAKQRLEELSSEISINQELKSSMTSPYENPI